MKTKLIFAVVLAGCFSSRLKAQDASNTNAQLFRPNVVKLNLSAPILYSPAFLFSYERTVTPHESFSVEAGFVQFPSLFKGLAPGIIFTGTTSKKGGFKLGGDYRFYLARENRYQAPHGLYIGPYVAYYHFNGEHSLMIADSSVAKGTLTLHTSLSIPTLGAQMGYQFSLIHDRIALDMVLIGPALTWYTAKLSLDGNIDPNEENSYLQQILDFMIQNFPVLKDLINNPSVSKKGRADLFGPGFRYAIYVGYRF